jgi:hypothetical protein
LPTVYVSNPAIQRSRIVPGWILASHPVQLSGNDSAIEQPGPHSLPHGGVKLRSSNHHISAAMAGPTLATVAVEWPTRRVILDVKRIPTSCTANIPTAE